MRPDSPAPSPPPTIGRRRFVAACGGIATLGAGWSAGSRAATAGELTAAQVDLTRGFSRAKFRALLNQTFLVETPRFGAIPVELVAVRAVATSTEATTRRLEQFSLTFRGQDARVKSGLYTVSHATAGRIELYLMALPRKRGAAPQYRVDFSLV